MGNNGGFNNRLFKNFNSCICSESMVDGWISDMDFSVLSKEELLKGVLYFLHTKIKTFKSTK
jgi:hypothetical protein